MDSPILIDLWTVDPSRREELVRRIAEHIRSLTAERQGFISAELYESVDGSVVMVSIRMRTVEDRQHLIDSAEAHAAFRELKAIARSHSRLYRLVETFGEPDAPAPS
jgi:heme-degrading monooxygenase HmoA